MHLLIELIEFLIRREVDVERLLFVRRDRSCHRALWGLFLSDNTLGRIASFVLRLMVRAVMS